MNDKEEVKGMIDLHCHLLPAVDDGAQNLEESLAMAEKRLNKGLLIFYVHRTITMASIVIKRKSHSLVATLQKELDKRNLPLVLLEGQEVRITGELLEALHRDELLYRFK